MANGHTRTNLQDGTGGVGVGVGVLSALYNYELMMKVFNVALSPYDYTDLR